MKGLEANIALERVSLETLATEHIQDLRSACAADPDIWDIYPHSMLDEHFEPAVQAMLESSGPSAVCCSGGGWLRAKSGGYDQLHQPQ
ncbi:MAG: hypothetical protein ACJ0Q8_03695 [Candidatus Azotimanducaceae bacterium]